MSYARPVRALALAAASALLTGFAFVVPAGTAHAAPSLKLKSVKVKGCRIRASGPVTRPACKRSSMVTSA